MLEIVQARIRRFSQLEAGAAPIDIRATGLESIATSSVEADGDEATRAGIRFNGCTLLSTGQSPVQALPTTTAQFLIYNPSFNTVSAFFDKIGVILLSGTGGAGGALVMCMVPFGNIPTTIPTLLAGATFRNANPLSSRMSNLIIASPATLLATAYANSWYVLANMYRTDTLLAQTNWEVNHINGQIVVAPGTALALAVVAPSGTTPKYSIYTQHREYTADME